MMHSKRRRRRRMKAQGSRAAPASPHFTSSRISFSATCSTSCTATGARLRITLTITPRLGAALIVPISSPTGASPLSSMLATCKSKIWWKKSGRRKAAQARTPARATQERRSTSRCPIWFPTWFLRGGSCWVSKPARICRWGSRPRICGNSSNPRKTRLPLSTASKVAPKIAFPAWGSTKKQRILQPLPETSFPFSSNLWWYTVPYKSSAWRREILWVPPLRCSRTPLPQGLGALTQTSARRLTIF